MPITQPLSLKRFFSGMAISLISMSAAAQEVSYELPEETAVLRSGEGMDVAEANCAVCHSYDYIETQPDKMGADFWEHEVHKMIANYGAIIDEADANVISTYLAQHY